MRDGELLIGHGDGEGIMPPCSQPGFENADARQCVALVCYLDPICSPLKLKGVDLLTSVAFGSCPYFGPLKGKEGPFVRFREWILNGLRCLRVSGIGGLCYQATPIRGKGFVLNF